MIRLKEKKKSSFEQDLYEAQVEEALAKWEAAKISILAEDKKVELNENHAKDEDSK